MVDFSIRIKELMTYFNISQADLCNRTGIGKSLISSYVNGKRSPKQDKIFILHQTYGVSIQWLLGYDYPMFEKSNRDLPEKFDFGYDDEKSEHVQEEKEIKEQLKIEHENRAINKLEKLTQITSALATMSDEDFEMVYNLAIRLSK